MGFRILAVTLPRKVDADEHTCMSAFPAGENYVAPLNFLLFSKLCKARPSSNFLSLSEPETVAVAVLPIHHAIIRSEKQVHTDRLAPRSRFPLPVARCPLPVPRSPPPKGFVRPALGTLSTIRGQIQLALVPPFCSFLCCMPDTTPDQHPSASLALWLTSEAS